MYNARVVIARCLQGMAELHLRNARVVIARCFQVYEHQDCDHGSGLYSLSMHPHTCTRGGGIIACVCIHILRAPGLR